MTGFRADGLDNPLSPNSAQGSANWGMVESRCEKSEAVESYDWIDGEFSIEWVDGNVSKHRDPQAALIEIREMSVC